MRFCGTMIVGAIRWMSPTRATSANHVQIRNAAATGFPVAAASLRLNHKNRRKKSHSSSLQAPLSGQRMFT